MSPILLPDEHGGMSPPREDHDAFGDNDVEASLWVNWRREFAKASLDDGHASQHAFYLAVPEGKFPRDMAIEQIKENCQEACEAKVNEIAGLYGLGCFKHWPGHTSNSIIDACVVITLEMIEGNVGVKCRSAVRGFKN